MTASQDPCGGGRRSPVTAMGHQGPFRPSRLSVRCRWGERTLAGTRGNDGDAPKAGIADIVKSRELEQGRGSRCFAREHYLAELVEDGEAKAGETFPTSLVFSWLTGSTTL